MNNAEKIRYLYLAALVAAADAAGARRSATSCSRPAAATWARRCKIFGGRCLNTNEFILDSLEKTFTIEAQWYRDRRLTQCNFESDDSDQSAISAMCRAIGEFDHDYCCDVPHGMSRRHFMRHLAGASALGAAGVCVHAHAAGQCAVAEPANHKSAILLWLGGGPPTIDMWDMKPGAPTGGPVQADRHHRRLANLASRCRCSPSR